MTALTIVVLIFALITLSLSLYVWVDVRRTRSDRKKRRLDAAEVLLEDCSFITTTAQHQLCESCETECWIVSAFKEMEN